MPATANTRAIAAKLPNSQDTRRLLESESDTTSSIVLTLYTG